MENQTATIKSTILQFGTMLGIISVAFGLMIYFLDMHYTQETGIGIVSILISIGVIVLAQYNFRKENEGYLSYKPSKYNKNVLRGKCVKCKKKLSTETHHILQQKDADKNGFVNGVHKNHAANLMVLCEDCHLKEHH